ncbi:MAG: hypothetical protein FWH07_03945 [Oscillospiraceae bacterium]|nr:hypothetical protein [Oscillospiraceae bacterium]
MRLNIMRAAFLIIGIVLIICGVVQGEPDEIMRKAVTVCLECIGIG